MTGRYQWTRADHRARPKAFAAVVFVCVALLALLAVVQVAHVHSIATDADHCQLCIVMHTAAPVAAVAAAIVLVQFEAVTPTVASRAAGTIWQRQLFIRPPPSIFAASF